MPQMRLPAFVGAAGCAASARTLRCGGGSAALCRARRVDVYSGDSATGDQRGDDDGHVSVSHLGDRSVRLSWPPVARAQSYAVSYGDASADDVSSSPLRSLRTTSRPTVQLKMLAPGRRYDVCVSSRAASGAKSLGRAHFSTTATQLSAADGPTANDGAGGGAEAPPKAEMTELSRLEVRIGRIVHVERHPEADQLYIEQVDVGEEQPRTIVSGLVKFVPAEELRDRRVLVLCNLKPRAMRGVTSHGMLLCASDDAHSVVDPLSPPDDAPIGQLITFEGHQSAPAEPGNRASKAFDRVAAKLRTNEQGIATYEDVPFATSAGPCFSPKKLVGQVS